MDRKFDRVNLSFEMVGSQDSTVNGEKSPIICLHGVTSAKESWKNVIGPIADGTGRKVYAYDARNHGDSGWSDTFDYDIMQEDLLQFMDCLHARRAILIGHSMGGKTAMFFAIERPERVEKLIVEDISPKSVQSQLRVQAQKYVQLLKSAIESIPSDMTDLREAKDFVQGFLHQNTSQEQKSSGNNNNDGSSLPLYQDENGKFKWKTNLKVINDTFLCTPSTSNVSGLFSGPTLILYGTKSPYKVSADRDYIRHLFPEAQIRAIEEATHQIHFEYEDVFVKEVVDFINES